MRAAARQWHLDGLRGIACLQVMGLHAVGAFLPEWRGSWLAEVWDGDLAVFVFFVLSGHVLTPAFLRGIERPGQLMLGRLVRFALPALLACLLGWAVAAGFAGAAGQAGLALGSDWLAQNVPPDAGPAAFARDAGLNVLLLGCQGFSVLDRAAPGVLWPNGAGFNPPLWTLSIELQGSLLVLLLCRCRVAVGWLWPAVLVGCVVVAGRTPYLGFVAGHVLALHPPGLAMLSVACVMAALALVLDVSVLPGLAEPMLWRSLAAIAVFALVQVWPAGREMLGSGWLRRLGELSFPLYLLHWPLLFGPGAAAALVLAPLGREVAGVGGIVVGLGLAAVLAGPFRRVDLLALEWSRRVREELPAGVRRA